MEEGAEVIEYRSLEWKDLDKTRFFVYNPAVFFCLRVIQHPFNVIKTRFQVQARHALYASPSSALSQTLRHEGIRGLYRGFHMSTLMLGVQQLYIVTYEYMRAAERFESFGIRTSSRTHTHAGTGAAGTGLSEAARNGIAAAIAVLGAQVIANPIDVLSQRLMLQGQLTSNAPMTQQAPPSAVAPVAQGSPVPSPAQPTATGIPRALTAREILHAVYRSHGLYGFYAGFFISCAQFIPSASLWWFSYPIYRDQLLPFLTDLQREARTRRVDEPSPSVVPAAAGWPALSWLGTLCTVIPPARVAEVIAGSAASATVAVALNPVDIIRTRVQVEGRSALAVARHLVQTEGVRGLWKGTSARVVMLMPQGAMSVWAYEFVKRMSALPSAAPEPRLA